jgi:endonuclease-8
MARLVLNQRVLAGIGNVYKSELLFLERIHPDTPVRVVGDDQLVALARRAHKLLSVNVGRPRSTTGSLPGQERESWVYGRAGKPCRRCGLAIEEESRDGRVTYWCPGCQPLRPA